MIDKKGSSLVEVLAVSAIIVILFSGIYSFFRLGQRTYLKGTSNIDLHHSVRLAAEKVIRQIRFADGLMLLEDWEEESADIENYNYIYFDSDNRCVTLLDDEGSHFLSDPVISQFSFSADGNTLLFIMVGEDGRAAYSLDSSVTLLNFGGHIANPEQPMAIRFSVPALGTVPSPSEAVDDPPLPGVPEDPREELELRIVHHDALPTVDVDYQDHEATLVWEEDFEHPITSISLKFSRKIDGKSKNKNFRFTGEWSLTVFFNGAPHLVRSEEIRTTKSLEQITHTFTEFIPANQTVKVVLDIDYGYGGHSDNWVKPEFSEIELGITVFR